MLIKVKRRDALTSRIILRVITGLRHLPAFFAPGEPLFRGSFWEWFPFWKFSALCSHPEPIVQHKDRVT